LFLPDIKALLMRRPATVVQHGSTAFTLVHMREGHINAMITLPLGKKASPQVNLEKLSNLPCIVLPH